MSVIVSGNKAVQKENEQPKAESKGKAKKAESK